MSVAQETPPRNAIHRAMIANMERLRRLSRSAAAFLKYGPPPDVMVHFWQHSPGDQLMCSAVLRELRQRNRGRLWMMSTFPELFIGNRDIVRVIPFDQWYLWYVPRFGGEVIYPKYSEYIEAEDRSESPPRHMISMMCMRAGISGKIVLKPELNLTKAELEKGRLVDRQIVIQSSGLSGRLPMLNKQWYPERFQQVVDALKDKYRFVQIGSASDPLLAGAIDLRGKTKVRESAAIIARSLLLVGLEGFPMHIARAVETRSVIVMGGRVRPDQNGYTANENLCTPMHCSPCWLWNRCDYGRECMDRIKAPDVIAAIERQVEKYGQPLAVDEDTLPEIPQTQNSSAAK